MKQLSLMLAVLALVLCRALPVLADVPLHDEILAEAAVLMDADTGQVLYDKNAGERMHPASVTKIMTALLALEALDPGDIATASETAVDLPVYGTTAGIQAGERMTVEETMYAMMLLSANEAANVLAEEVSGSLEDFAALMNQRAEELGAAGTHFSNAHGLPAKGHYTTARDMALITRQSIATPGFLDYFGAGRHTSPATNLSGARSMANTHRMLLPDYGVYNGDVIGGKTGYTGPSGYTLVTVARREERTLICVVLKSASYYTDTQALLDFGFDEFSHRTLDLGAVGPFRASIWDGDREAGQASFRPPAAASLLLHDSLDLQMVAVEYRYPDSLSVGERVAGDVLLTAEGMPEGLPGVLLALPMETRLMEFDPPEQPPVRRLFDEVVFSPDERFFLIAAGLMSLSLLVGAALLLLPVRGRSRRRGARYYGAGRIR